MKKVLCVIKKVKEQGNIQVQIEICFSRSSEPMWIDFESV